MSLVTGKVTPKKFWCALNEHIFPSLGIELRKGLSECMAQRWLVKLGWQNTRMKKGVYMDRHERQDVKTYWQDVFLPKMAKYKQAMVKWNLVRSELKHEDPILGPGEKRIVPIFQDESLFHANEYKQTIWCAPETLHANEFLTHLERAQPYEIKLMRKGQGHIIHVSDFVEKEFGRLVIHDQDGVVVKDAQCITYPGTNNDPWWDHNQLLEQMNHTISIFEELHPGCAALFIFHQLSAHASLGSDALCAFGMNKTNGGNQRKKKDTIIPMNNPHPAYQGKPQKMTTESGEAKGLKQTLKEQGFILERMPARCSPVCPIDNQDCCMAQLLSNQDDFHHQEQKIKARGHFCIFLPKFHCELNPIEMVGFLFYFHSIN
jgi:hypothetical protein